MNYPIHSPAVFAYRDHPLEIRAFLRDGDAVLEELYLLCTANGTQHRVRMLPVDGVRLQESYSLYGATLPAECLSGEMLEYAFELNGKRGACYRV